MCGLVHVEAGPIDSLDVELAPARVVDVQVAARRRNAIIDPQQGDWGSRKQKKAGEHRETGPSRRRALDSRVSTEGESSWATEKKDRAVSAAVDALKLLERLVDFAPTP